MNDTFKSATTPENMGDLPVNRRENAARSKEKVSMVAQHGKTLMATMSAALGAMASGSNVGYTSPALPNLNSDPNAFYLSTWEISWVTGIISIGGLIGLLVGGLFVDRFGRKATMIFFTLPFVVGWVLIAMATSVHFMYVGRFLTGFCSGVMGAAVPVYIAEISHQSVRGFMGSCQELSVNIGNLFVFALGIVLPWNTLAGVCALLPVIMLLTMMFMPESPRFLLKRGRRAECIDALRWLRGPRVDIVPELTAIDDNLQNCGSKMRWREFGHLVILKPLSIVVVLLFCQQFYGSGVSSSYWVTIFDLAGATWNPYAMTAVVGLIGVCGNLLSALIVDKVGRRTMLVSSAIFTFVGMGALSAFFTAATFATGFNRARNQWIPLVALITFNIGDTLGYGPVPFYLASELFPLRARGLVGSISVSSLYVFMFATTFSFPHLIELLHAWMVFWIMTAFSGVAILVALFIVPETSGKSLEAIELENYEKYKGTD